MEPPPIVIAHRGASGYLPEHTLEAYALAVEQGADYIEPDLVATKDGVLVARHENEIGGTTDVASRPEFRARRTRKVVDGVEVEGWFTEDFTLAELKRLRARERIPQLRPLGTRFDGTFEIPTLEEILALVKRLESGLPGGRRIGLYPETKHPTYFASLGLPLEAPLLRSLERAGYAGPDAPVFIQSFEVGNLQALASMTSLRLVQLVAAQGAPYDLASRGDPRTYADLIGPRGLEAVAGYAHAVGVDKSLVIPRAAGDALGEPTGLVAAAHSAGLLVHAWTFRAENAFLPAPFRSAGPPHERGDLAGEIAAFLQAGLDGVFADHPDLAVQGREIARSRSAAGAPRRP